MYLRMLGLKDFAGHAAVVLEGFEPGLNIVVGDNEAGKSTLLMALRAAFFQKHRATGEAVKALAPYGRQVRPEIAVAFETGGTAYTLRKGFLQRPDAELTWPGGSLVSDAVEERLSQLLGFAHPGSGKVKLDEHQGAFGLLWVEQGRSREHDLDLGVGKNAITSSLEGEIGQILGGERGRALLAAAKALQDRFFTAGGGRASSSSPLGEVEEALRAVGEDLRLRQAARKEYEEKIDRLRSRRETLQAYLRDDVVGEAEKAVEAAEAHSRTATGYGQQLEIAKRDFEGAEAYRAIVFDKVTARQRLADAAIGAAGGRGQAVAALDDLRRLHAEEAGEVSRIEAWRDEAYAAFARAEGDDEAASVNVERQRLVADIGRREKRLGEAAAIERHLADVRQADAVAPRFDRKMIGTLETAEQARREAEIRVAATAPSVMFEPLDGRAVRDASGVEVAAAAMAPVLARTVFDLDGFGRMTVEPGSDAGELRRALAVANGHLGELLSRHGVKDLDEARRIARDAEKRSDEIALLVKQLEAMLPEGTDAASKAHAADLTALSRLNAGVTHLDDVALDAPAARTARKDAQARLAAAEAAFETARKVSASFAARLARAEVDAEHRADAASRTQADLAEAEGLRTGTALREDLAAADLERSAKAAVVALRRSDLDQVDVETVARTLHARQRGLVEIRGVVASLRDETSTLEGELRAQGLVSLGEDIARLEGEIHTLEGRRRRLALEAAAARLLYASLCAAQREAREHWLGPIKAQVAPFLKLIHPGSEVAFDDSTLAITGLVRRGVEEDFKRLSAGAREQVAVVTRLALAKVLKDGGHPALVILDDALVNTDEHRLERMHLVLQRAAEAMQIIILTCRERDFRGLGGKIFRL